MSSGDTPTYRASAAVAEPVPPVVHLENGDRLPRCEFEKRCLARPDIKKAELSEQPVR